VELLAVEKSSFSTFSLSLALDRDVCGAFGRKKSALSLPSRVCGWGGGEIRIVHGRCAMEIMEEEEDFKS
jgi:hypothetical protein